MGNTGMSFDSIRTTSNHLFYTREMYRKWNVDLHRSERILRSQHGLLVKN